MEKVSETTNENKNEVLPRVKSNRGRKPKPIDWDVFDKLANIQCTQEEIASFFNCSADTIERKCVKRFRMKFAEYFAQKKCLGKVSLRRSQYRSALNGSDTMLIWLGKQWLGQSNIIAVVPDQSEDGNKPQVFKVGGFEITF